ncbi:CBS domain-containing protein [Pseudidiomarina terrestris]|uniref:CBS domain-containing protein n=1 Tax=Pseudidiomarina terrestris TaxID=2820060 RepID=A0AAW7R3Y9_9GAMM|nr:MULTISPECIES: CBS domain-containing protein [unclassified Pseudidiomarina]MDN7125476.1 CBS domain-containing protein [Pseudidiomarina sp. 1APP75-32.1]MDN7128093.1 CBS domain-containing protein [Pseudidiomarina sp. 1APR75-33.1]MDN7130234.1 CBS domain-containing protein [Pseudidiomarina sp. 1APR75-15]MDN7135743.1 CBS domain-containing protein [Pseudidiomarina sp. 1ASP75-5]MDN7137220.1 CBS domain-containing protein [Pseudidiomarina sp. 1ASP75-14]
MQVKNVMTTQPQYLKDNVTIREAALTMRNNKSGFEPLTDANKVTGVITDRDVTVRAVAEGKSLDDKASSIATERVLYTYQDEDIESVVQNMVEQKVQRLLVLNDRENKDLVGVVTLGDIANHCETPQLAEKIVKASRTYS